MVEGVWQWAWRSGGEGIAKQPNHKELVWKSETVPTTLLLVSDHMS